MHCTLLVPHLFWPHHDAEEAYRSLVLEPLQTLLARADAERYPPISIEGWLCQAYQVERQQDWPIAPLTLVLDGGDAGDGYWLRADPVHLQLGREQVLLMEAPLLGITREEAQALVAALNAHFASRGLTFQAPHSERWYVHVDNTPDLVTHTVSETAGEDVRERLPAGADAMEWHRLFNEAQMLLHAQAANEAREAAGRMTINSVWFWGGGTQPRVPGKPYGAVWTNHAVALALAVRADAHAAELPPGAEAWLAQAARSEPAAEHLIVADILAAMASYRNVAGWQEHVAAFNARWVAPLVAALKQRKLRRLTVIALSASACWRFDATAHTLMKLWRRPRSLHHYA
jgi:hypothetical protein